MALHAISVSNKVSKINEALKMALQKHHKELQRSEHRQMTGIIILIFPIDCCITINDKSDG